MKYKIIILAAAVTFNFFGYIHFVEAGPFDDAYATPYVSPQQSAYDTYTALGYTCVGNSTRRANRETITVDCTKTAPYIYGATVVSPWTLTGTRSGGETTAVQAYYQLIMHSYSPFVYLNNAPEGPISVSLDSSLDTYFPKPNFNQKNGWLVASKNGEVSLGGEKVDHLFYELALSKIALTRNGRNFSSKDGVEAYLKTSNFLTSMGFTAIEAENSLMYMLDELATAPEAKNYYLTVLDDTSVSELSSLNITPAPDKVDRHYFAIYPTAVPVKTTGDFVFPLTTPDTGFTVKETGELLLTDDIFVTFK